ncbi:MAG: DeoR/GlpR transcriptional regulator [Actinobacteria bacterium]|nr:DeoR/GlpR transcriptional regulator [Actinomycetota bacterium]
MIPEARRNRIIDYIKNKRTVTIPEVSREFDISEITVRRDFDRLVKKGLINKVYGGATIIDRDSFEPVLAQRMQENTADKRRIAREALNRISDGDIILVEAGTTCLELVKILSLKKKLKVISAAPHILNALIDLNRNGRFDGEIMSCGGIWQKDPDDFFAGPQALRFFEGIKIDISFFGIFSIDLKDGWMTPNIFEVELTKVIIGASRKVIGITHHSKFNRTGFTKIGSIDLFDEIITDSGIEEKDLKDYGEKVKITVA